MWRTNFTYLFPLHVHVSHLTLIVAVHDRVPAMQYRLKTPLLYLPLLLLPGLHWSDEFLLFGRNRFCLDHGRSWRDRLLHLGRLFRLLLALAGRFSPPTCWGVPALVAVEVVVLCVVA